QYPHRHELQQHRPDHQHELQLPRPRHRRRRQPRPLLQHLHRHHLRGHDAALGAGDADRHRHQQQPDQHRLSAGLRHSRQHRPPEPRHRAPPRRSSDLSTPTGTSYNNTGLTTNTSYSYRVRATDAAGNLGPYSNTFTATTSADTTLPSAPGTLTGTVISSSQI